MKTTRIAIIGAMEEETREIEQFLTHVEKIEGKAGLAFMEGEYGGLSVIAVRCGIGKVNAALCTQIVLDLYDPELVINVGVAGGIAPGLRVGDVVISDKAQQHDVDTSAVGDPKGVIPAWRRAYSRRTLS
ncbi:MAG: 5'-methylthioadenosine/S-adenosylhomocysteine nucleosidase [Clostridia bacterium]